MNKRIYISNEVFEWDFSIESYVSGKNFELNRAYEIFYHAESLINTNSNEFQLADGILNLKRVLNHRLQIIEKYYNFKIVKFKNRPKGYLEILEKYDLARPFIIEKLRLIRNDIEHRDAKPPNQERCKELLDITWYFLRSTDRLIQMIVDTCVIKPTIESDLSDKYYGIIRLDYEGNSFEISGWFPESKINNENKENYFEVNCSKIDNGENLEKCVKKIHKDKTKDDIFIVGKFTLNDDNKHELVKKSLRLF